MINQSTSHDANSNTSQHQRQRIKTQLHKHGSFTTAFARDYLDIPSPAPRVFELRHNEGLNIHSVWTTDTTAQGNKHKFVRYVLKSGKYGEVANDD
jgi:hypothetical protein